MGKITAFNKTQGSESGMFLQVVSSLDFLLKEAGDLFLHYNENSSAVGIFPGVPGPLWFLSSLHSSFLSSCLIMLQIVETLRSLTVLVCFLSVITVSLAFIGWAVVLVSTKCKTRLQKWPKAEYQGIPWKCLFLSYILHFDGISCLRGFYVCALLTDHEKKKKNF